MNSPIYISTSCIGAIILILMRFNFGSKRPVQYDIDDILFRAMLWLNLAILLTDASTWVFDGAQFPNARIVCIAVTTLYYLLQPVMCLCWLLYCEYKLTEDAHRLRRRLPFYMIPALINLVMTVCNFFSPVTFFIDEKNHYQRAPYYSLYIGVTFIYFVYAYFLIRHTKRTKKAHISNDEARSLLVYPVFPIAAAVIQSLIYGISIIAMSSMISLLLIYFNIQNAQITTDALTGISNRFRFESYLAHKMQNTRRLPVLFLLMIDIDYFKKINDSFGHPEGDRAIRQSAKLLLESIPHSDFAARIGGDEFVVIGERTAAAAVGETMETIRRNFASYTAANENGTGYTLSVSIGCAILDDYAVIPADELLSRADTQMYLEKQAHHEASASVSINT